MKLLFKLPVGQAGEPFQTAFGSETQRPNQALLTEKPAEPMLVGPHILDMRLLCAPTAPPNAMGVHEGVAPVQAAAARVGRVWIPRVPTKSTATAAVKP